MNILFFYYQNENGELIPCCELEQNHKLNPITGFLNDPMGGFLYMNFLKDCLNKLNSNLFELDLSSNSWGVEVKGDNVFIYFLYSPDNKNFYLNVPRVIITELIESWISFVETKENKKDLRYKIELK